MRAVSKLLELIEAIHRAPHSPDGWPEFLGTANRLFETDWAHLHVDDFFDDCRPLMHLQPFTLEGLDAYTNYYRFRDPRNHAIMARTDVPVTRQQMISDKLFRQSEIFNDFLNPQGTSQILVIPLRGVDGKHTFFCVTRPEQAGPFGDNALDLMRPLASHLHLALKVDRQLGEARSAHHQTTAMLEALNSGALLVRSNATVSYANSAAENIFAENDGLTLDAQGRLRAASRRDGDRLLHLLTSASDHSLTAQKRSTRVLRPSMRQPYEITIAPVPQEYQEPEWLGVRQGSSIVFITDPEALPVSDEEQVRGWLGLTPAEARLALGLTRGQTLREYADAAGLTYESARSLLKQIFAKTGVRSQAQIVRKLLIFALR